ncbi:MAG: hypothetical protein WD403_15095, partial [Pirellulales bacterium]
MSALQSRPMIVVAASLVFGGLLAVAYSQQNESQRRARREGQETRQQREQGRRGPARQRDRGAPREAGEAERQRPVDAIQEAQVPRAPAVKRPEQEKTEHDRSDRFAASNAPNSSPALEEQPEKGQILGFDFFRDPLNAKHPLQTFEEIMQADVEAKAPVMEAQRQLLERRYNLEPRLDPEVTMSRGKPIPV